MLADGTVVTVDALVEGVHWDERLSAADVGFKSVAVSVSDVAAMGARPSWMVLSLSVPSPPDRAWIDAFARGVADASRAFGVDLVGGDTTGSPGPRFVAVTLGGRCSAPPVTRSGGCPGDLLLVTGHLGLAAAGYALPTPPPAALAALRRPMPRVRLAAELARYRLVHAMMDVSDGLASDLPRLCRASGTGARLSPERLPIHPDLREEPRAEDLALGGGDDYELLLAAPPAHEARIRALATRLGVPLTAIGELVAGDHVELVGRDWPADAFAHFRGAR